MFIKLRLYCWSSMELVDSEIISIAFAPPSSAVIFINDNMAHLLIGIEGSCIRIISCFNIASDSPNRSCIPSVVPVTPIY